jgi:hypothetical protein
VKPLASASSNSAVASERLVRPARYPIYGEPKIIPLYAPSCQPILSFRKL